MQRCTRSNGGRVVNAGRAGAGPCRGRRAFSLMELLTVILIIAIVVAILFPVLGGARNSARNASTTSLLNQVGAASAQFINDQRSAPGYFSPADMAVPENANRGFSAVQNVMLDLAGGITTTAADGVNTLTVGPASTNTVVVDLGKIGAPSASARGGSSKAYFNPDRANFVAQETMARQDATMGEHRLLPTLVDAFGTPILAWTQDAKTAATFAAIDSSATARFYWTGNAAFLRAQGLGKLGKSQRYAGSSAVPFSLLGQGVDPGDLVQTMEGVLGHPAFPAADYSDANRRAAAARAPLVLHSAGPNGIFLGSDEQGGSFAKGSGGAALRYTRNDDVVTRFDDVLLTAGN